MVVRERETREVRTAADTGDDDVGLFIGQRHLLDGLQTDDRLVQAHVIEHGAQRVVHIRVLHGHLDRLRDGDTQRTGRIRVHGQHVATGFGQGAGRLVHGAAVGLHEDAAVRLLVVADADHEHLDVDPVECACDRHGAAPLAGAGLGRDLGDPLELVVVRLRDGGVGLVRAGRAHALVLVEDLDALRQAEVAFELACAKQGRGPVRLVDVDDRTRDVDPAIHRHLLLEALHGEQLGHDLADLVRSELDAVRRDDLGRRRRILQIRNHVVPSLGDPGLIESESGLITTHRLLLLEEPVPVTFCPISSRRTPRLFLQVARVGSQAATAPPRPLNPPSSAPPSGRRARLRETGCA